VTKVKLPPIIATIATLNIYRGLAYMMIGDNIYYKFPAAFRALATTKILQIPSSVYFSLIFAALCYLFLKYHYTGRHAIAVGANNTAARLAGVRSDLTVIKIYGLAGFLFSIAGIIMTAKLNSSQAVAGTGIELHIIAVTVIGGTSLAGGYGTILGTVMGTILIALLENSLIIMNVSYFWQKFVLGLMIVVAVAFRTLRQDMKKSKSQGK
jgi:ribose/xylose/arabinose/galactoside ABC-type transport system permease subunit